MPTTNPTTPAATSPPTNSAPLPPLPTSLASVAAAGGGCVEALRAALRAQCGAGESRFALDGLLGVLGSDRHAGGAGGRVDVSGFGDEDLVWAARRVQRALNALEAVRAALAAEALERDVAGRRGDEGLSGMLVGETSISSSAARRVEREAAAVAAKPEVRDAFAVGSINSDQAAVLATAEVPEDVRGALIEDAADAQSTDETRRQVRATEARWRLETDEIKRARQRKARSASMWLDHNDGTWNIRAKLDPITGDRVNRALNRMIAIEWRKDEHQPEAKRRTVAQRAADALAALIANSNTDKGGSNSGGSSDTDSSSGSNSGGSSDNSDIDGTRSDSAPSGPTEQPDSAHILVITHLEELQARLADHQSRNQPDHPNPDHPNPDHPNLDCPDHIPNLDRPDLDHSDFDHSNPIPNLDHPNRIPANFDHPDRILDRPNLDHPDLDHPDLDHPDLDHPDLDHSDHIPAKADTRDHADIDTDNRADVDASNGPSPEDNPRELPPSELRDLPDEPPDDAPPSLTDCDGADMQRVLGTRVSVTESGTELTVSETLRLACDAGVSPVVLGGRGEVLHYGRTKRSIPPHLRRALIARDSKCVWPGCHAPPIHCVGHHILHWLHHGPTDLPNLALLCHRHHNRLHKHNLVILTPYADPAYANPEHANPGYAGPGYAGPGYAGPGYAGPGYAGPGYAGPGYAPTWTVTDAHGNIIATDRTMSAKSVGSGPTANRRTAQLNDSPANGPPTGTKTRAD